VSQPELLPLIVRWVRLVAVLTMVGAAVFRLAVARRAMHAAGNVGAISAASLLLCGAAWLVFQTAAMRFPGDPWAPVARQMVFETSWGVAWRVQLLAALGALVAYLVARARDAAAPWWLALAASLAVCATLPAMGHAMSAERLGLLAPIADFVHVAAAGVWLGALTTMAVAWRRADPGTQRAWIHAFSPLALTGAGLVAGSGLLSSYVQIGEPALLLSTPYGRVLLGKVALVAAVAAMGFRNWRRLTPAMSTAGTEPIRRGILLELIAMTLVLLLTAALVVTPPPTHAPGGGL
jgi:putative copper export protein